MASIVCDNPKSCPYNALCKAVEVDQCIKPPWIIVDVLCVQDLPEPVQKDGGIGEVSQEIEARPKYARFEAVLWNGIAEVLDTDFFVDILYGSVCRGGRQRYEATYSSVNELGRMRLIACLKSCALSFHCDRGRFCST